MAINQTVSSLSFKWRLVFTAASILSLLFFFSFFSCPLRSFAQNSYDLMEFTEEMEADELDEETSQQYIVQKKRLAAEIDDLRLQLLAALNDYEQDERDYRIVIDQYQNLQTLSSIEEAITATKKAMLSRNQVLDIYQNLLRLKVIEAEGIELSHKRRLISDIETNRSQLDQFEQSIKQAYDRDDVNNLALEFEPLGKQVKESSYYALSLLAIGKLHSVYDKMLIVHQKIISAYEVESDPINQPKIERSFDEIDKLIVQLPPMFEQVWAKVDQSHATTDSDSRYARLYANLNKDLMPIYSNLSKVITYLEEIERLK